MYHEKRNKIKEDDLTLKEDEEIIDLKFQTVFSHNNFSRNIKKAHYV